MDSVLVLGGLRSMIAVESLTTWDIRKTPNRLPISALWCFQ